MASFFDQIVDITKTAQKNDVQLRKESDILFRIIERKIKKTIKDSASRGRSSTTFDFKNLGHIDMISKYSMYELLTSNITEDYVPVIDRLLSNNPTFHGFDISRAEDDVFVIDWTQALVKKEPEVPVHPSRLDEFPPTKPEKPKKCPGNVWDASCDFTNHGEPQVSTNVRNIYTPNLYGPLNSFETTDVTPHDSEKDLQKLLSMLFPQVTEPCKNS